MRDAIARVLPVDQLRWIGFSYVECDECGALNDFLGAAPRATAVASRVAATIALGDSADRPVRPLADGEVLVTGQRRFQWLDTPHLPHGWECGFLFEQTTRTLLCGDLFTQPGRPRTSAAAGSTCSPRPRRCARSRRCSSRSGWSRSTRPGIAPSASTRSITPRSR